jgi:hypothetical protein
MDHKPHGHESDFRHQLQKAALRFKGQRKGIEVRKATKVVGKRIGGAQRAEQARQQKRRDSRH